MANNIKELRLLYLLTPRQFARRIGIYPEYVARLEGGDRPPSDLWIDAVVRALGAPRAAVTNEQAFSAFKSAPASARVLPDAATPFLCPIGARYAIRAMIAKLAGFKTAQSLDEDDLADAVQSLVSYVGADAVVDESRTNRLSQGLQITVLTILQSRAPDLPEQDCQAKLERLLPGARSLLRGFSEFDDHDLET